MIVRRKLSERLQWFPEARFGMFVHFGLYSLLERGEWVMYDENIPREEYEKLARRFDPRRFDADEWVATARRAGARYITVTAKHHDGFCLFDSALTDYKITRTPFGRDLIGELVAACHRARMRIILYYSQPDWHHPNFVHRKGAFKDIQYERADDEPNWPKYLEYCEGQVRELCTNYGRIDGIWFDGVHKTERQWRGRRLYELIKRHQPGAVVNDRAGYGDFFTPERSHSFLASAAGYTVESCQSVAVHAWGYQRDATLFSAPHLIESLVQTAAAGGNYLLNVGPKADGTLPADWVERLYDVGEWLGHHGKSIYGSAGCPMQHESDELLYTRRGRRLYLHLLRWPDVDAVVLRRLLSCPRYARLVRTGQALHVERCEEGYVLRGLPSSPPDPAVNVIELLFEREAVLSPRERQAPAVVHFLGSSPIVLPADAARRSGFGPKGSSLQVAHLRGSAADRSAGTALVRWSSTEQKAAWIVESDKSRRCEVTVEMACPAPYNGSTFSVRIAGQTLRATVPPTRDDRTFRTVPLGTARIPRGRSTLVLAPERLNYGYVFASVRRVRLRPVE